MAGKLRLGVIGAGSWAVASHLPNLTHRRDEVEFVAVSRLGGELLHSIKQTFGFRVASEDYRDVIEAGIDICVVSSPTALHYEHAKAALEAGASVLVEKPSHDLARPGVGPRPDCGARPAPHRVLVWLELPSVAS